MSVFNRSTRRHDKASMPGVLLRALAMAVFLGGLAWLAISVYNGVPGKDYRYVNATVPNAGSLILHDAVRVGGVREGQVTEISTSPEGDALLRLQLNGDTKLTEDTKILVRANGLLGARYVELIPSREGAPLPQGAPIKGDDESLTFGATDALDVLDKKTRGKLRPLISELSLGLMGQGRNVNDLLRIGGAAIPHADSFFATVNRPLPNRALLPSLASMMAPLDENRVALGQLFGAGADALAPIPDRRASTQATLDELPPTLEAADIGLSESRTLLAAVRSLAAETRITLPPAPAALRETALLLEEAQEPLRKTNGLLQAVRPAVPATLGLLGELRPVLPRGTELFRRLVPVADTIGPYKCDIVNFGAVFRSMTGFGTRGPGGPGGPPMQFRLQAASPTGAENLGVADPFGVLLREGYPPPCKYLSKPYPVPSLTALGGGR
jgi:phospholipid/cholesterol/gamma-HCH transport system substrate-binding protein